MARFARDERPVRSTTRTRRCRSDRARARRRPGQRLRLLTADLPKTLLPVDGDRTILDITLANLRAAGIEEVVVVTGFAAERIEERAAASKRRHGVRLELVETTGAEVEQRVLALAARGTRSATAPCLSTGTRSIRSRVEERCSRRAGPTSSSPSTTRSRWARRR